MCLQRGNDLVDPFSIQTTTEMNYLQQQYRKLTLALVLAVFTTTVSILTPTCTAYDRNSSCVSFCGSGKSPREVPYPFGFSSGCPIQLTCTDDNSTVGGVRIGEFRVLNITPRGILVNLPAECNRPIETIKPFFSSHYALASRNGLLLRSCSKPLNDCVISTNSLEKELNMTSCNPGINDSLRCYSLSNFTFDALTYENVSASQCDYVFSSVVYEPENRRSPVVSVQLEVVELEWWLEGDCRSHPCDKNGNCTDVKLASGKSGFRCQCNEGFAGDGFPDGCQRESDCNASKYLSGRCGGTTRVGVLVGGLLAGASLVAGLAALCYFIRRRSTSLRNKLSARRLLSEAAGNSTVPFYSYKEIERATNCFSEKQRLGTGAYGTVYAGKLQNEEWVAIKKIRHRDTDGIDQVMNEIKLLSSVSHPNLVRLLGCCIEEGEQILVYEFMPNGTLSQHLQRERGDGLPWTVRLTIAAETANAIAYLHSAMNPPIYHRDIKSSNILLDYKYKSKVADFGLSRLGMVELSHVSTAPQGTPGYLDPEYHQYFHLSDKSDVYSFGVVLAEIITALKVVDFSRSESEVNLAALAIDRIRKGCVDEIIDPYLEPHRDAWTLSSIHNVAELAFRCLAFHRDMRPSMMEVAEELEHIRLSAWVPSMCMPSPSAGASSSSSENGSEKSLGANSGKRMAVASRRSTLPQKAADCSTSLEKVKDRSPVSVQDTWVSEQSSPSTNSLLGNVVQ